MSEKKPRRLLFRLIKGFIYGNVVGLIFGTAIFLLAAAVEAIVEAIGSALPAPPALFLLLIYAACVVGGTAVEYSDWLEAHA